MKSVIIPILILVILITFTVTNGIYVDKKLTSLIDQANALDDIPTENTLDDIKKLEKKWNEQKETYSAIIKFDFVYNFSKEISAAKAGCIANDPGTYLAAKKSIVNILEYLRDIQKLRLDNLI